jgi:hypothetical protein
MKYAAFLGAALLAAPAFAQTSMTVQSKDDQWLTMVRNTAALSASQNNGKATIGRVCHAENGGFCINTIYAFNKQLEVSTFTNTKGNVIYRQFCSINEFRDIMSCQNFDTGQATQMIKTNAGWKIVK